MKKLLIFLLVSGSMMAQSGKLPVKSVTFDELEPLLNRRNDTTYVVNFWATWCGPCVKELPYFEELHQKAKGKKMKVLLVSLDFPKQLDKLMPFIERKKITADVIHLNDPDANSWIPKVDAGWSGAIPATLIYRNNKRRFYEKSFTKKELEIAVSEFINL